VDTVPPAGALNITSSIGLLMPLTITSAAFPSTEAHTHSNIATCHWPKIVIALFISILDSNIVSGIQGLPKLLQHLTRNLKGNGQSASTLYL
jgi:hypothetical protein